VAEWPEGAPLAAESPEEAESPESGVAPELAAAAISADVAVAAAGGWPAVAPPVAAGWAAAAPPVAAAGAGWAAAPVDLLAARPVEGSKAAQWEGRVASAEEPAPEVREGRADQPTVASTRADLAELATESDLRWQNGGRWWPGEEVGVVAKILDVLVECPEGIEVAAGGRAICDGTFKATVQRFFIFGDTKCERWGQSAAWGTSGPPSSHPAAPVRVPFNTPLVDGLPGKGMIAQAIVAASRRTGRTFLSRNMRQR
jgi:hypothetical protein